jgi:hypothetical protein
MDFILRYWLMIWLGIAVVCIILGTYFTIAKSNKHGRSAIQAPTISERRPQHVPCLACGRLTDDPEALFCWFCGSPLDSTAVKSQSQRQDHSKTTVLVSEHALEQELREKKQARWR